MKVRQRLAVFLTLGLAAVLSVGVAWADPRADNPNTMILTNVVCDNGVELDTIVIPGHSTAALDPDSALVGIAKSVYFDPAGANILVLKRGAQGSPPTVWCEWDVPEGHFGGDIVVTPADR